MAESKRSFILYADLLHTVEKMPKDKAGELFMTILEYVNDKDPEVSDLLVEIAFEPVKQQLKRDLNRWEGIKDKRSEAGKASAEARRLAKEKEQNTTKSTSVKSVQQSSTNPTVTVNGNVTVNDTVNVIKKERDKENSLPPDFIPEIDLILTKKIMDWFGFNEVSNFDKLRQVSDFQKCLMIQNKIDHLKNQLPSYMAFKSIEPKFKHSFAKFLGSPKLLYEDGQWNAENWIEILKNEKLKGNGAKNQGSGIRSNKPIVVSGDTYTDL